MRAIYLLKHGIQTCRRFFGRLTKLQMIIFGVQRAHFIEPANIDLLN